MTHSFLKLCNGMYWLALTMWVAALASAGIAAMNVFGTLPGMRIALERFAAMPPQTHGRIAAGLVMADVFFTVDLIQFVAVPVVVLTLLMQLLLFGLPLRAPANMIRSLCILGAACVFAFHATMLAPRMNRELRAYWGAAEAGEMAQAENHLEAFNARHPIADNLLRTKLVLLVIGVMASAAALGPHRPREHMHIPSLLRMR
jgi:hypothetical protein